MGFLLFWLLQSRLGCSQHRLLSLQVDHGHTLEQELQVVVSLELYCDTDMEKSTSMNEIIAHICRIWFLPRIASKAS